MRFYEMVLITRSELTEEAHKEVLAKIETGIQKKKKKAEKGEFLRVDDWGIKRLAHPIEKQTKGRYDLITMKCMPDCLPEVETALRHSNDVFRYQTIVLKSEPKFEEPPVKKEAEPVAAPTETAKAETAEATPAKTEAAEAAPAETATEAKPAEAKAEEAAPAAPAETATEAKPEEKQETGEAAGEA